MRESITLTAKEILDLARFTGLDISEKQLYDDWYETEYTVCPCHKDGVKSEESPEIPAEHYRYVSYVDEYPEEGVMPLGNPIKKDVRDEHGGVVAEGDTVHFCFGIPPIGVDATIKLYDGKLWAMTPDHTPKKCLLSELKENVGSFYKIKTP